MRVPVGAGDGTIHLALDVLFSVGVGTNVGVKTVVLLLVSDLARFVGCFVRFCRRLPGTPLALDDSGIPLRKLKHTPLK